MTDEASVLSDPRAKEFAQIISDQIFCEDLRVGGEGNIADAIAYFMADDDLVRANDIIEKLSAKAAKAIAIRSPATILPAAEENEADALREQRLRRDIKSILCFTAVTTDGLGKNRNKRVSGHMTTVSADMLIAELRRAGLTIVRGR